MPTNEGWKKDWPQLTFMELVDKYLEECMAYLKKPRFVDGEGVSDAPRSPYVDEEILYYKLRELKDACMERSGEEPLDWKGN